MIENRTKLISKMRLANYLQNRGYTLCSTMPDRRNNERVVWLFMREHPTTHQDIQNAMDDYYNEMEERIADERDGYTRSRDASGNLTVAFDGQGDK